MTRTECPARRAAAATSSSPTGSSRRNIFEYIRQPGWTARKRMASWGPLICHCARRVDLRGVIDYLGPARRGDERGCTSVQKLTVERLPRFGFLLAAMVAELTLGPFIVMATQSLATVRLLAAVVLLAALSVADPGGSRSSCSPSPWPHIFCRSSRRGRTSRRCPRRPGSSSCATCWCSSYAG